MIISDDARRESLPLYEVKELSLEEAMRVIAMDRIPVYLCLPEDYPTTKPAPAFKLTA